MITVRISYNRVLLQQQKQKVCFVAFEKAKQKQKKKKVELVKALKIKTTSVCSCIQQFRYVRNNEHRVFELSSLKL